MVINDNIIRNLNLIVTSRCNSKCIMCDIWKTKCRTPDISMSLLRKIVCSSVLKKSKKYYGSKFNISFTGGEPFMRSDFDDVFSLMRGSFPESNYTISTNGLLTKRILDFLENNAYNRIFLHISLDGTMKVHDIQRGVVGSYLRTMETINKLRESFPGLKMKLKFTITPVNYMDILDVYGTTKKYGIDFGIKPVEYARNYTNIGHRLGRRLTFSVNQVKVINSQLRAIMDDYKNKGEIHNSLFVFDIMKHLENKKTILESCNSPKNTVFVMPNGNIFSCVHLNAIGNLFENDLDAIWNSKAHLNTISLASKMKCPKCISFHGSYASYSDISIHEAM